MERGGACGTVVDIMPAVVGQTYLKLPLPEGEAMTGLLGVVQDLAASLQQNPPSS
jgi:hypothetical protein